MQITKCITVEGIEKAATEIDYFAKEWNYSLFCNTPHKQERWNKITAIILSHCTEPQSSNVRRECAEEICRRYLLGRISEFDLQEAEQILAHYFPDAGKARGMKELLEALLEECHERFNAATEQWECTGCGMEMIAGFVHKPDCIVVKVRKALGLEGE